MWPTTLRPLKTRIPHKRLSLSGTNREITEQTISAMRELVTTAKRQSDACRKLALSLIQNCQSKDWDCYIRKIFNYVQSMKYVYDPNSVELLQSWEKTVEYGGGDCDDQAILVASLLESIGVECEFAAWKANPRSPNQFTHVSVKAIVPGGKGRRVTLETTMQNKPCGWSPPFGAKTWPASYDESENHGGESMSGLSGIGCAECGGTCNGNDDQFTVTADDSGAGLSGLGEAEDKGAIQQLMEIYNGATAQELKNGVSKSNRQQLEIEDLRKKAIADKNQIALNWYQQARNAWLDDRNKLYAAVNQYNFIAKELAALPFADAPETVSLSGLGGLGVLPAAVLAWGAVSVGVLWTLTNLIAAWRGGKGATDGYIEQFAHAIGAFGGVMQQFSNSINNATDLVKETAAGATSFAPYLIIGGLMFVGFRALQRAGRA